MNRQKIRVSLRGRPALCALGLILLVLTLITNVAARLLVRRVSGTALPVGRGL